MVKSKGRLGGISQNSIFRNQILVIFRHWLLKQSNSNVVYVDFHFIKTLVVGASLTRDPCCFYVEDTVTNKNIKSNCFSKAV